jgi:hypothetical protein
MPRREAATPVPVSTLAAQLVDCEPAVPLVVLFVEIS